jgi:hypothetical protein
MPVRWWNRRPSRIWPGFWNGASRLRRQAAPPGRRRTYPGTHRGHWIPGRGKTIGAPRPPRQRAGKTPKPRDRRATARSPQSPEKPGTRENTSSRKPGRGRFSGSKNWSDQSGPVADSQTRTAAIGAGAGCWCHNPNPLIRLLLPAPTGWGEANNRENVVFARLVVRCAKGRFLHPRRGRPGDIPIALTLVRRNFARFY